MPKRSVSAEVAGAPVVAAAALLAAGEEEKLESSASRFSTSSLVPTGISGISGDDRPIEGE